MARKATVREFWAHEYTRSLPPRGKLALYYALGFEYEKKPIILEDMALATGLDTSECTNWLSEFGEAGMLEVVAV